MLAVVAAVVLVAGGGYLAYSALQSSIPTVSVTTVTKGAMTDSVVAVGDILSSSRSTITLSPSSKVVEVLVEKGQRVEQGVVLVRLDTAELQQQLDQQSISLSAAQESLGYLTGAGAEMNETTADNAVSQARIALDGARAAKAAAGRQLADVSAAGDVAVRQARIGLDAARVNADAAAANVTSTRQLGETAVAQAAIPLEDAKDAVAAAEQAIADLDAKLAAGLITQAEYDAQLPPLQADLQSAQDACVIAQLNYDTATVNAEAANVRAQQAAASANLAVDSAKATLDSARQQADAQRRTAQKAVSDAGRAVDSAEVALSGARSAADHARAADDQAASAQQDQIDQLTSSVSHLQGQVDQGSLRAAVAGVVSRMEAEAGQYPQLGDVIVVDGTAAFLASVDVDQADSVGIEAGQRATVTLKGIGTVLEGTVASVAPIAERSATAADNNPKVTVEVAIADPGSVLRIGFDADVEIFRDDKPSVLTAAVDAVRSEPGTGRRYVFVLDANQRVGKVFVTTGIESGPEVEITSGLSEGQRLVLSPPDGLADGATVRVAGSR